MNYLTRTKQEDIKVLNIIEFKRIYLKTKLKPSGVNSVKTELINVNKVIHNIEFNFTNKTITLDGKIYNIINSMEFCWKFNKRNKIVNTIDIDYLYKVFCRTSIDSDYIFRNMVIRIINKYK